MSDRTEELDEMLAQVTEEAAMWRSLLEHPAWEKYVAFVEEQMALRQQSVCLTPINSMYGAFSQEFFKGEFSGMRKCLTTPQTQYEQAEAQRNILSKDIENHETPDEVAAEFASRLDGDPYGQ